ncbi:hypothetical protein MKZ87_13910 [Pseudomonas sp. MCal1]|uniref:hypothetical protein n=1 Tax=Pseudomonas sp. MCal1 TaxID=2919887 RepID=UPI002250BE2A|nr:hypothetical protein [Pseudomonas sp. MCal1]MCX4218735.1 hypothetical protein [Pseudomonas sp. MCal1]
MSSLLSTALNAEREHAAQWWGVLNQLRLSSELPDWVRAKDIGSDTDYQKALIARSDVNQALFGVDEIEPSEDLEPRTYECQRLIDLMELERTRYLTWWTMLSEMRARKQLPDWVVTNRIANGPDHDRWTDKSAQVNQLLFGQSRVRHLATQLRLPDGPQINSRQRAASLTPVNC